jgi:nucleotide-binding universal stress UspA family protein
MYKRILIPFDGSNGAETALRHGLDLAKLCGAEVQILTVYRHHAMIEASLSMVRPKAKQSNPDEAMKAHAKEVAAYAKQIAVDEGLASVRAFTRAGQPARTIVSFAHAHEADLIVIGARGLGSVETFLLGSVSHKVTGLSKLPVLVV